MRIIFLGKDKKKFEYIRSRLGDVDKCRFEMFSKSLNDRNLKKIKDADGVVLFINEKITRRVMRDLPELEFIATMSTGYDHIDVESASDFGISVCNVPVYGANTVAEHTFGLILNLSRKIWKGIENVKENNNFSLEGLKGFDLKGKTIGIIGLGNIGKHVARMAYGFEMKILCFDKKEDNLMKKMYGVRYVSFDELLRNSDIISLHVPLNKETKHMINKENVNKIKRGALLINTARGGVVETGALRYALDRGILSGAGLDVLEGECEIKEEKELVEDKEKVSDWKTLVENHLLIDYENVIVTPHMAFYSVEAEKRILDTTIDNINGFLKRDIKNKVN